jgi:hypothetical protein
MPVLKLRNARLAFPHLFVPQSFEGSNKPKYGASLIIGKDHPQVKEIEALLKEAASEKWGAKGAATLDLLRKKDRVCLHDGNDKSKYDGFTGNLFISASSDARPGIKGPDGKTDLTAQDGRPYAGCYVHAILDIWAQDNKYGQRINAGLKGVLFVRDGDAFSGSAPANDEDFDDLAVGADAEMELV